MMLHSFILVSLCATLSYGVWYDQYTGQPLTKSLFSTYEKNNLTSTCAVDVKPCDPNEWRRVDGTCNNLEHPAGGTFFSRIARILSARFHNGNKARRAKSGAELPGPRLVRTTVLGEGPEPHDEFNHNIPSFGIYKFNDIGSVHDIENMLLDTTYCCEKEHQNDEKCTPNLIPNDDRVFRYSSIRCMNSTRPLTHQDFGCTKDSVPSVIKKATTYFDESQIYNAHGKGDKVIRSFEKGMLTLEEEDGKLFPPNGPTAFCPNNQGPNETRCFENYFNTLLPVTLYNIWFTRHHNFIAGKLAELNPCWDDDRLFYTARDINSAYSNQMWFREWNEAVQGRENLLKAGVITEDNGYRDLYDPKKKPSVTLEYTHWIRWFHLMQEETAKLHDKDGQYVGDYPLFDATFKIGYVAKNMELFTQSTFRAPCHAVDGTIAPDLGNRGLPGVQEALDILAGDMNKGRNFGIAPYVDYIHHFMGVEISTWEDLLPYIPQKYIDLLKTVYVDVEDLDAIVGLWCSRLMEGGHIPELLAAVLNDNWHRAITSDRHWYERPNRPHAFTLEQLLEIRKGTLSLLLCNVGDGVSEVPRKGFLKISDKNPLVPCSEIPQMNYNAWADDACNCSE